MNLFGHVPAGGLLYGALQRSLGRLSSDPFSRTAQAAEMIKMLKDRGCAICGSRFLEVGTGHKPIIPIILWLCGAEEVVTLDLHRRLNLGITADMIACLVRERARLRRCLGDHIESEKEFDTRIERLAATSRDLHQFLSGEGIKYMAPCDAAATGLHGRSYDFHCSCTVLEHVPENTLRPILAEARRLLKPGGRAVHLVDLSDHFQHADSSITRINFLKFSRRQWSAIASNEFGYCNRLRASDYVRLLTEAGWVLETREVLVDDDAIKALQGGFRVHPEYRKYAAEDLCAISLRFVAKRLEDG